MSRRSGEKHTANRYEAVPLNRFRINDQIRHNTSFRIPNAVERKKLAEVTARTKEILREHPLCDHCLGRMFARNLGLKSHARLG